MKRIPPGYDRLFDKIDEVGRELYPDGWCGWDELVKRRDEAKRLRPAMPPRTPRPPNYLGSSGPYSPPPSPGRTWTNPDPDRLLRQQDLWQEAERLAAEAGSQWSQAVRELQRRLYGTPPSFSDGLPAYELMPDGTLLEIPRQFWFGDAAEHALMSGLTERGRPVLIRQTLGANLPGLAGAEADSQAARVVPSQNAIGTGHGAAASDEPTIYSTGLQGRPTSWSVIEPECRRRYAEGERHPNELTQRESPAEWADVLISWLQTTHPRAPPVKEKTLTNKLPILFRELAATTRPKS